MPEKTAVMGQSSDTVPAGLATVEPLSVKSEPKLAVPPELLITSWLAKLRGAAEITTSAAASATAIERNFSVLIVCAR